MSANEITAVICGYLDVCDTKTGRGRKTEREKESCSLSFEERESASHVRNDSLIFKDPIFCLLSSFLSLPICFPFFGGEATKAMRLRSQRARQWCHGSAGEAADLKCHGQTAITDQLPPLSTLIH